MCWRLSAAGTAFRNADMPRRIIDAGKRVRGDLVLNGRPVVGGRRKPRYWTGDYSEVFTGEGGGPDLRPDAAAPGAPRPAIAAFGGPAALEGPKRWRAWCCFRRPWLRAG